MKINFYMCLFFILITKKIRVEHNKEVLSNLTGQFIQAVFYFHIKVKFLFIFLFSKHLKITLKSIRQNS